MLSLLAWSKGLQCTKKACKILRKGNLRRQCYDAIENGQSISSALEACLSSRFIIKVSVFVLYKLANYSSHHSQKIESVPNYPGLPYLITQRRKLNLCICNCVFINCELKSPSPSPLSPPPSPLPFFWCTVCTNAAYNTIDLHVPQQLLILKFPCTLYVVGGGGGGVERTLIPVVRRWLGFAHFYIPDQISLNLITSSTCTL